MKTNWQTKLLWEVCEIKPPKSEARRKLANGDLVSFLPMADLGISEKFLSPRKKEPLGEVAENFAVSDDGFANGDLLLAKNGAEL